MFKRRLYFSFSTVELSWIRARTHTHSPLLAASSFVFRVRHEPCGVSHVFIFQDRPKNSLEGTPVSWSPVLFPGARRCPPGQRLFVIRVTTIEYLIPDKLHDIGFRVVFKHENWKKNQNLKFKNNSISFLYEPQHKGASVWRYKYMCSTVVNVKFLSGRVDLNYL